MRSLSWISAAMAVALVTSGCNGGSASGSADASGGSFEAGADAETATMIVTVIASSAHVSGSTETVAPVDLGRQSVGVWSGR